MVNGPLNVDFSKRQAFPQVFSCEIRFLSTFYTSFSYEFHARICFKLILNFKALKNWNCRHVFVFNHFEELNKGRRVKWSKVLSVDFSKPLRCFKV